MIHLRTLRELYELLTGLDREGTPRAWRVLFAILAVWLLILYISH